MPTTIHFLHAGLSILFASLAFAKSAPSDHWATKLGLHFVPNTTKVESATSFSMNIGVRPDDDILAVNDHAVNSAQQFENKCSHIAESGFGEWHFTVLRNGQKLVLREKGRQHCNPLTPENCIPFKK